MMFGPVPVADALGAVLAHGVRLAGGALRKGHVLTAPDIARLQAEAVASVVVARLEPQDMGENDAAAALGQALANRTLRADPAATGRVNLFAEEAGVLLVDAAAVSAFNAVDEAITLATLPAHRAVTAGEMIATVKIIPYGVARASVEAACAALRSGKALRVAPYRERRVGMISTLLPGLKPATIDKTRLALDARLQPSFSTLTCDLRVPHESAALAEALTARAASHDDLIIVFGASAIADRRDVIPAALLAAGGTVEHLGMPVDPGNLLMLGEIAGKPVIGAPGCARSPKENGFDWVLQRLIAGLKLTGADLQAMGVGGLLMEIVSRPQPRAPGYALNAPHVASILLAAGRSTRMGAANKLRQIVRGKPLLRHAAEAALASRARPLIVVTGHEAGAIEAALAGLDVTFVHNPAYAEGLATSLRAGIAALPPNTAGAMVLLGDMPNVSSAVIDRLLSLFAASPDAAAVVPTLLGQRGNPVLLARALFTDIATLSGDEGARRLLAKAGDAVIEAAIDDPTIALDVDTPEALAALREGPA